MRIPGGLGFLGLDEDTASCPHCGGYQNLNYVSFSKRPISCEACVFALLAEQERPEPTWLDDEFIKEFTDRGLAYQLNQRSLADKLCRPGLGNSRKVET